MKYIPPSHVGDSVFSPKYFCLSPSRCFCVPGTLLDCLKTQHASNREDFIVEAVPLGEGSGKEEFL